MASLATCSCPLGSHSPSCARHGFKTERPSPEKRGSRLKPGKRPRQVSDKQAVRLAYLAGVKAERISNALLLSGEASCSRCPKSYSTSGAAHQGLDLHHTQRRSGGHGYRPGNAGVDAPAKVELLCRPCHRLAEKNEPEWSIA